MTGANTKSAFAGVLISLILMFKYSTYIIPLWCMNMKIFGKKFLES